MNAMDRQQRLETLKALAVMIGIKSIVYLGLQMRDLLLAVVERYTKSVRFEDSLKFYASIVG